MTLTEIYVQSDGEIEFTFRGDKLLMDHFLVIKMDSKEKVISMSLQG